MEAPILFVDDDSANLTVFEATFEGEFPLVTASSAEEALKLFENQEFSVLISDQRMPKMTGVELLERVHEKWPDTIRILITAYSDLNAAVAAINQGHVNRYLRKPWVPDELRAVLLESRGMFEMNHRMRAMQQRLVETERMYALGVVAAGLAQEMRKPVTWVSDLLHKAQDNVRAAVQMNDKAEASRASISDRLQDVDASISDSLVGIQRLMDVVRGIETPARDQSGDVADLGDIVRLTLKVLRREVQQAGQVRIDMRSVPKVRGSSTKLSQVVLNLLTYTTKALIQHKQPSNMLTMRLNQKGDFVVFEIADNGPGIDTAVLPSVFDVMFVAKNDISQGLGLVISKTIVEELGGKLEAENIPEGGSLFRVTMPIA